MEISTYITENLYCRRIKRFKIRLDFYSRNLKKNHIKKVCKELNNLLNNSSYEAILLKFLCVFTIFYPRIFIF